MDEIGILAERADDQGRAKPEDDPAGGGSGKQRTQRDEGNLTPVAALALQPLVHHEGQFDDVADAREPDGETGAE